MDAVTISFAAVGISIIVITVRRLREELAPGLAIAATIALLAVLLRLALPVLDFTKALANSYGMGGYLGIMMKALGIALCSRVCAEICRDCGENSISVKVELGGKIGILLLSLPLLQQIVNSIDGLV